MNGPVLDPDKEESTMEALGMIETRGPGCTD
ncbi:detox protein in ethanolamine utilization [Escherichia coli]|nr:detox protein in ethanolamine utilization [Escherichia coli]